MTLEMMFYKEINLLLCILKLIANPMEDLV